jgi:hypothetical protein
LQGAKSLRRVEANLLDRFRVNAAAGRDRIADRSLDFCQFNRAR